MRGHREKAALSFVARNERELVAALMACVLLGGVAYTLLLGETLRYPDEREYVRIASHLNAGRGYTLDGATPTAYRPPGYTVLCALGLRCGGGIAGVRILNLACLLLCVDCVFRLARKHGVPGAGCFAALGVVGYPVFAYTAGTLYPQTLAACLLLFTLRFYFGGALDLRRSALCGVLMGMLILTAPAFVFVLLVLLAFTVLEATPRRAALVPCAVLLAGACVIAMPWQIRNQRRFGATFFVSTNGGINLLLGNSESTTPNAGVNVDVSRYTVTGLGEVERDRHYRRAAMAYVRENPVRAAGMYALKFLNYFNFRNRLRVASEQSWPRDVTMLVTYGGLLLLVAARLLLVRRHPLSRFEGFALWLYVLNGAFAAVFITRIRLRLPFDWLLVCIAGTAAAHLLGLRRGGPAPSRSGPGDG